MFYVAKYYFTHFDVLYGIFGVCVCVCVCIFRRYFFMQGALSVSLCIQYMERMGKDCNILI